MSYRGLQANEPLAMNEERPFPPHLLTKLDELWAERPFSLYAAYTDSWRMASGAWLGLESIPTG
ncbi:MAG: hypothetical protein KC441_18585 [Anaerolineales bacterium]|nr:hypothetical protein [Anaerolineales bacterium]